jgi:hypothetical protein
LIMCNTSTSGLDTWDSNPDKGMEMFFFPTLPRIHLGPNLTPMKMTPDSTFWLYHKADPCPLRDFWCRGNFFYFLLCKLFASEIAPGSMPTKWHHIKLTLIAVFCRYYKYKFPHKRIHSLGQSIFLDLSTANVESILVCLVTI